MSKMDSYMQGRTEGMEFALRLVKDKGIEERNQIPTENRYQLECHQTGTKCSQQ